MIKFKQHLFTGLFALTFIISSIACGESKSKVENIPAIKLNVELNEGKKWDANPETTQGIENMKDIMNQFDKDSEIQAYKNLSSNLESEFTMIFQKCTMKGEAHNQLHNYLIPLKDYIKALKSDNKEIRSRTYASVQGHLAAYSNYFK